MAKRIRTSYVLTQVAYSRSEAMDLPTREFGWKDDGGKLHESTFTAFVPSHVLPVTCNIDYRRVTPSSQFCTGAKGRTEALRELGNPPFDPAKTERQNVYVAKKLGLASEELQAILEQPPRWYTDFPNDRLLLDRVDSVYRGLQSTCPRT